MKHQRLAVVVGVAVMVGLLGAFVVEAQAGNLLGTWAPRRNGITVTGGGASVTVANAPGNNADGAIQCIPVTGGQAYEFSAGVTTSGGTATMELNWRRGPECEKQGTGPTLVQSVTGSGNIVLTGTAPGDATIAELQLIVPGASSATFNGAYFGAPGGGGVQPPPPPSSLTKRARLPMAARD